MIKKLNEQFAQTFSGDGFNSSNGVFKVKYKPYDDLSQAKGRVINPYDHIRGEEIQTGDFVKARIRTQKNTIIAEVVSVKRTADGKGSIFKIKDSKNNKIYNLPSYALEIYTDNGNVVTSGNSSGTTVSNREKFLTSLKYNAGNFVWSALESKSNEDILFSTEDIYISFKDKFNKIKLYIIFITRIIINNNNILF
jgi:hypothetical protein